MYLYNTFKLIHKPKCSVRWHAVYFSGSDNIVTTTEWFLDLLSKFPITYLLVFSEMSTFYIKHLKEGQEAST